MEKGGRKYKAACTDSAQTARSKHGKFDSKDEENP